MKNKQKQLVLKMLRIIILAIFLILVMFPFVWMLLTSLKGSQGEIYAFPVQYLPEKISFANYTEILWKG
ncbi:MAG: carbohydrate ABC transporter permease, partial [Eubacteriales bacterium]|nr:carbohydrate ABC transporter permease [Eubacteriales bacterium]